MKQFSQFNEVYTGSLKPKPVFPAKYIFDITGRELHAFGDRYVILASFVAYADGVNGRFGQDG